MSSKYTLDNIIKICNEKGGECLSNSFNLLMEFKCKNGHYWKASPYNVIGKNSWCPLCSESLYERICRLYFETLFKEKFPKTHPNWLRNDKRKQLELDGYCEKLNLAFEHNGKQHYQPIYGKPQLLKMQENDNIKISLCNINNVKLIIIPELFSIIKIDELKDYIKKQCIIKNVKIPDDYDNIEVDYKLVYNINNDVEKFNDLKSQLFNHGYELLDNHFYGALFKYNVKCIKCGNVKFGNYSNFLRHKCAFCLGIKKKNNLDDAIKLAKLKNGKLISKEYINNCSKMLWECEFGHRWWTSYNLIQKGRWCPKCYELNRGKNKKLSISIYKQVAINKGGKCLSNEINSCYDKLEWECKLGHRWLARADRIKNTKGWCPICYKNSRYKKN